MQGQHLILTSWKNLLVVLFQGTETKMAFRMLGGNVLDDPGNVKFVHDLTFGYHVYD